MKKKAVAAMSGGVDSSVAALLLLEAGYDVIGATMRLVDNADLPPEDPARQTRTCCSLDDVEAYCRGDTPNPCIDCNRYLKFEKLLHRAMEIGCDCLATGHYARVGRSPSGRWLLQKGLDASKDQSYVLWSLTQEELSRLLLPLGGLTKAQVREIAEAHGFVNAARALCGPPWRVLRGAPGDHPLHGGAAQGAGAVLPPAHVCVRGGRGGESGGAWPP